MKLLSVLIVTSVALFLGGALLGLCVPFDWAVHAMFWMGVCASFLSTVAAMKAIVLLLTQTNTTN